MVSALVPGSSGPGSSPDRGHCVVFKLNPHNYYHDTVMHFIGGLNYMYK